MHKSKGKWIVVGVLLGTMGISSTVVSAEEAVIDSDTTTLEIEDEEASPSTETQTIKDSSLPESDSEPVTNESDEGELESTLQETQNAETSFESESSEEQAAVELDEMEELDDAVISEESNEELAETEIEDIVLEEFNFPENVNDYGTEPAIATFSNRLTRQNERQSHTVKSGEYLYLIGQQYGVTVQQIKQWNNLTSNYIYSGDELIVSEPIQSGGTTPSTPTTPTTPPENSSEETEVKHHTVVSGDNLWKIATNNGITVAQLKSWNNLTSNYIYSGDRLILTDPSNVVTKPTNPEDNQEEPVIKPEPEVQKTVETLSYYTVKRGDNLWKIATQYNITVSQLKTWNNLKSNYIYSGDRFIVSDPNQVTQPEVPEEEDQPEESEKEPEEPKVEAKQHVVKTGEYLWLIANQNNITVAQLKAWNNLTSNYIYPGDRLIVTDPSQVTQPVDPQEPEEPVEKPDEPKEEEKPETPTEDEAEQKTDAKYHVVKSGEYLWLIANQNNITVSQLKAWNNLTSNYIYSGDRLIVTDPTQTTPDNGQDSDTGQDNDSEGVLTGTHVAVQAVLNQYRNSPVHVFYESLLEDDLRTASLNGDVAMYGASVPKVVLVAYTLEQIEKGNLSWDTPIKYTSSIYNHPESYAWGGSGTIQYENYLNKTYTLKDVVYRTIAHSDNLGSNMLLHYVGYRDKADFNRFTQEVYGAPSYNRDMTPRQINKVMKYIYEHPQQYAMQALDKTNYDNTKLDTVQANVYQKIGGWWPYYNHSTGIIDSNKPYIVTILTDYWSDSSIGTLAQKIFDAVMK